MIFARPHAISALKPKDALEQNEFARPCGTVSEKPLPGRPRVEIDLQERRNNAIAGLRQLQGLLDEFFGGFALIP
jgi:hypothetical protein